MLKKALLLFLSLSLLLPAALAKDDDNPTIAILRFGPHDSYRVIERALVNALPAHGLIKADERVALLERESLSGDRVSVVWGDADFDYASVDLIVEHALDEGADVLVTLSTPVTLVASLLTADMDDPPAIIFSAVYNPFEAGIAQSPCVKPQNITGIETLTPYEDIVPLLLLQNPDIQVIGTVYNSVEISGNEGAKRIVAIAESLGLKVRQTAVTSVPELKPATEALVSAGAEALLIPTDMTTVIGMPIIMQVALEKEIPVFHSVAMAFIDGATVGVGGFIDPAMNSAHMATVISRYLDGSLDIASAGIVTGASMQVNVNLDMAEEQGIHVSEELLVLADFVLTDGAVTNAKSREMLARSGLADAEIEAALDALAYQLLGVGADMALPPAVQAVMEALAAANAIAPQDLLEANRCTPERIAEQQAALDAAEG